MFRKPEKKLKNCNKNIIETVNKNKNKNKKIIFKKLQRKNKSKILQRVKRIMEYTYDEKNALSYNLAIKYDRRPFTLYYVSLLKTKHKLIFSFFQNNDYNSKIIKIDIFFVSFTIYYVVNCLFFDDDTMHELYEAKGSFNIEYQITKIIYSSLISSFFNTSLSLLALSDNGIIAFKNNKLKGNVYLRRKSLEKILKIKFIIYFVLSFIFLLFFWYYISMFGAIYKNTQFILLEDTSISFVSSFISPLFIYLIPSIFRIYALSNPRKNRKCLYNFSKLLQMY